MESEGLSCLVVFISRERRQTEAASEREIRAAALIDEESARD